MRGTMAVQTQSLKLGEHQQTRWSWQLRQLQPEEDALIMQSKGAETSNKRQVQSSGNEMNCKLNCYEVQSRKPASDLKATRERAR